MAVMTGRRELWERALDQHGYVTLRDARELGLSDPVVWNLAARGTLARVAQGVYRFPEFPDDAAAPYMLAVLWTGAPEACLSHDTALALYEVCDINPDRIHVTVDAHRRVRRAGELYVVHNQDLEPEDRDWWQGVPMVAMTTAIEQCLTAEVPGYLLRQALERSARTGAITEAQRAALERQLDGRGRRLRRGTPPLRDGS